MIFLAVKDCIYVYNSADFSSNRPPDPVSFFPFNPLRILRPSHDQVSKIKLRSPGARIEPREIVFNSIRTGWIGHLQESLVAVGEFGTILVWNLGKLEDDPILLEGSNDFESTWGIAISPNNFLIATSSNSHAVSLFHFPSRKVIYSFQNETQKIHFHNIPSLDFSPCGAWLVSCSIEGKVAVWSLIQQEVTRFELKKYGWGWLVRFVSPNQYTSTGKTVHFPTISKRFYTSSVKDDIENDSPYGEMDTIASFAEEDELDEDYASEDFDAGELNENFQSEVYGPVVDVAPVDPNQILQALLVPNEGGVHLSEGAGDTWATDPEEEEEGGEGVNDYWDSMGDDEESGSEYVDTEIENNDLESSDFECDGSEYSESDYNDFSSNSNSFDYSETSEDSEFAGCVNTETLKISFVNTEGISLFPTTTSSLLKCPYDIFYFTRESFLVISPSESWVTVKIDKLAELCMMRQKVPRGPFNNSLFEALARRLSMGEWLSDIGTFLAIDSGGHLIALSPKIDSWRGRDFDSLLVPDVQQPRSEIVGYAAVKKVDAEYGVKVHVYLVCADGTFRLYEVAKTTISEDSLL